MRSAENTGRSFGGRNGCASWGSTIVWIALLVGTTPANSRSSPLSLPPAAMEKIQTAAKDDMEQLSRLEGYISTGEVHEVELPLRSYVKTHLNLGQA